MDESKISSVHERIGAKRVDGNRRRAFFTVRPLVEREKKRRNGEETPPGSEGGIAKTKCGAFGIWVV